MRAERAGLGTITLGRSETLMTWPAPRGRVLGFLQFAKRNSFLKFFLYKIARTQEPDAFCVVKIEVWCIQAGSCRGLVQDPRGGSQPSTFLDNAAPESCGEL